MPRWSPFMALWVAATAQAAPEQVPLYREIKDWVVACDNLRGCEAISAADGFDYRPLSLNLQRAAGPRAPLQLSLHYAEAGGYAPLQLDGRPLASAGRLRLTEEDDGAALEQALHQHAASLLDQGMVDEAWKTLLSFNAG